MKKILIFTILLATFFLNLNAQNLFQKTFGKYAYENGYIVKQTNDKGYIILASSSNNYSFGGTAYLIKTDSLGNKIWSKFIINYTNAKDIIQTSQGEYIIVGGFGGNTWSSYIIKLSASGNIVWQKEYAIPYISTFNCVCEDIDGSGYIAAGNESDNYFMLVKIDNSGGMVWTQNMLPTWQLNTHPLAKGIIQSRIDSSFFVLSTHYNGNSQEAIIVSKFKKNGTGVWSKTLSANLMLTGMAPTPLSIKQLYNGNMIISSAYGELYFIEIDLSGAIVGNAIRYSMPNLYGITWSGWDFVQPNTNNKSMFISGISPNENPISAGASDIILSKTDATGNIVWTKKIGGKNYDDVNNLISSNDKGVVMIGSTKSFSVGQSDVYLLKSDSLGTFTCNADAYIFPNMQFQPDTSSNLNSLFNTIQTNSSVSNSTFSITNVNDTSYDACVCVPPKANFSTGYPNPYTNYDIQSNSTWATKWFWNFGNNQTDTAINPYLPFISKDTTYTICLTVTNSCGSDSVCHSINYLALSIRIRDINKNSTITIFPNPFTSQLTIAFDDEQRNTTIKIIDLLGKEIKTINFTGKQLTIEKGEMQSGIYFVQIIDENKNTLNKKIIIQ